MNRPYRILESVQTGMTDSPNPVPFSGHKPYPIRLYSEHPFIYFRGSDAGVNDTPVAGGHAEYIAALGPDELLQVMLFPGDTDATIYAAYIQFA